MDNWLRVATLFFNLTFISSAYAAEMSFPMDIQLLNKRVELTTHLDDEDEAYWALEGDELIPILSQAIPADRLEDLRKTFQGKKITHEMFKQIGWTTNYDLNELIITIDVPVSEQKYIDIPLEVGSFQPPPTTIPHVKPASFSGILNTYWSHSHNLKETEFSGSQVAFRTLMALGPITFEDAHTYSYNHFTNEGHWLRTRMRIMTNLPDNTGFLQFGDYQIETDIEPLPSGDLFGISYSYQPQYLKWGESPNVVPLSLETTSLVSIKINGQDYRTLRLSPGQYNLNNLPLEQGVNEVEVTYIDQSGIEQKRYFNVVDHPQLLLKGDIETQWVYGAEQVYEDNGNKEIDTSSKAIQGVISYGMTDWWTISPALELKGEQKSYFLGQSYAFGDYFLGIDGRYVNMEKSHSYDITGQLFTEQFMNTPLTNLSLRYGINKSNTDSLLVHSATLSSSIKTPLKEGFLSFNLEHRFNTEQTLNQSASINASYRFLNKYTTSLNLRWQKYRNTIDRSLYLSLSVPIQWFGQTISARSSYNSDDNEYQSSIGTSKFESGYYWRTTAQFKDTDYDGFDGYGKVYTDKVDWSARYSSRNVSTPNESRQLTVGADTGIAWAGNQVAWTSPVSSSFNLVSIPEEYKEKYTLTFDQYKRLQLTPAEKGGSSVVAIPINNDGYKIVKINSEELDFNEELNRGEYVALGGLYSGSHYPLIINRGYFVSGFFHNGSHQPLAEVVGEFQSLSTKETYPFFTDKDGNFELDVLPVGQYNVYFYDNAAASLSVDLSQAEIIDGMFIDLGILRAQANHH